MNAQHVPKDLAGVARRLVCYEPPEQTLAWPALFLAHVMTYGTVKDIVTAERYFSPEDFQHALDDAPPGVFDPRSWAYWNTVFDRVPVPPMPKRKFLQDEEQTTEN